MRNDDSSVRQLVDELSSAALRDLLRNVRHHTELRRQIASGMVDERTVNQAYREYARQEGAGYRQRVADITLQYYSDLLDLGNQYSGQFYANVLDGSAFGFPMEPTGGNGSDPYPDPSTGNDSAPGADLEEVPIELHGPPGREVVATFALENTESRSVALALDVGPCEGPDDESFMAPLTVHPARFVLEPGASRSITLRLVLLPSVFTPGLLYRLPVFVRGPGNLVLRLTIWVEEADAAFGSAPADTTATTPATEAVASAKPPAPRAAPRRPRKAAASRRDAPASTPSPATEQFLVRCPGCKRDFERRERDSRLRPHKTPDGDACPERRGRVRKA